MIDHDELHNGVPDPTTSLGNTVNTMIPILDAARTGVAATFGGKDYHQRFEAILVPQLKAIARHSANGQAVACEPVHAKGKRGKAGGTDVLQCLTADMSSPVWDVDEG